MKKHNIVSAVLAFVIVIGLLPGTAFAAEDAFISCAIGGKVDEYGGYYELTMFTFQFEAEKEQLLYSDLSDIAITKDGQSYMVEFDVPADGKLRKEELIASDGECAGMGFFLELKDPVKEEGVYVYTCKINGKEAQSFTTKIVIHDPNALGAKDNPFLITNEAELRAFAEEVNSGNDYRGKFIVLTNDIALTGEWAPIGRGWEAPFYGTFDGGGHTISGVRFGTKENPSLLESIGFFDTLNGSVSALTIDVDIYAGGSVDYWQSVSGFAVSIGGSVSECYVTGNIVISGNNIEAGGFAEWVRGNITDCGSSVLVSLAENAKSDLISISGFAGKLDDDAVLDGCSYTGAISTPGVGWIGGLLNTLNSGVVRNCYVKSDINGKDVGGLISQMWDGTVTDCRVEGTMTGTGSIGGFVCSLYSYSVNINDRKQSAQGCLIENSFSKAAISGESHAGGFICEINWQAETPLIIRGCHASGNVAAVGQYSSAGGFAGSVNIFSGSITNCYATGNVTASGTACGFAVNINSSRTEAYLDANNMVQHGAAEYGATAVSKCFASGNVAAAQTEKSGASGFVMNAGGSGTVRITDCAAFGDAAAVYQATGFGTVSGKNKFERCFAAGNVSVTGEKAGTSYAFGNGSGSINDEYFINCYATGNAGGDGMAMAFPSGRNCYFTGTLKGAKGNVVYLYTNTVNSYGDMTVEPEGYISNDYGKTTAGMQSQAFADLLNAGQPDKPWKYKEGGYPVLSAVNFNTVTIADTANGKIIASTGKAAEGNIIVMYAEPDSGYQLKTLRYNGIAIDGNSFAMPDGDVTVAAEFVSVLDTSKPEATPAIAAPSTEKANTPTADTGTPAGPPSFWNIILVAAVALAFIGGGVWAVLRKKKHRAEQRNEP